MTARLGFTVTALILAAGAADAQTLDPVPKAAIVKGQQQQAGRRSFRVIHRSTSLDQGRTTSVRLIFVAPDRFHSTDLDGLARIEVIRIGSTGWMKFPGEGWQPEIVASPRTMRWFRGPTAIDDPEWKLVEARTLGPGLAGTVKSRTYQYTVARDEERVQVKVWIADATGLPMKFEADVRRRGSRDRDTWDVEYDDTLTIERPVK